MFNLRNIIRFEGMSNKQQVSNDPLDYARAVFYLRTGHAPSEQIRAILSTQNDIILEDVDRIKDTLPAWVSGVPTAVEISTCKVIKGSSAVAYAKTLIKNEPIMAAPMCVGSGCAITENQATNDGFTDLFTLSEEAMHDGTDTRDDKNPSKTHAVSLEEMVRLRERRQ